MHLLSHVLTFGSTAKMASIRRELCVAGNNEGNTKASSRDTAIRSDFTCLWFILMLLISCNAKACQPAEYN